MATPSQDLMKRCTRCRAAKPLSEFYAKDSGAFGVAAECRQCTVARTDRWRQKPGNWDRMKAWARNQRSVLRDRCLEAYGGCKCACCGETEKLFLSLDHINNDGAEWRRKTFGSRDRAGYRTYLYLVRHGFPSGFQVLCGNCQYGKRMNNGICPHQVRRNDQAKAVESSDSKRNAAHQG